MSLDELAAVAEAHAEAIEAAVLASELRAVAAYRARAAGATLGELALALGIARPNVPALVRRGEALTRD